MRKLIIGFSAIMVVFLMLQPVMAAVDQSGLSNVKNSADQTFQNASQTVNDTAQEVEKTLNPIQDIINTINSIIQQVQQIFQDISNIMGGGNQ